jgi:hypothetical protein
MRHCEGDYPGLDRMDPFGEHPSADTIPSGRANSVQLVFFIGRWTTTIFLAALAIASSVKPEDAVSNISGWASYLHLPDPEWIQSHSVDRIVFWGALAGLALLLGSWILRLVRRKSHHKIHMSPDADSPKGQAVERQQGSRPELRLSLLGGNIFVPDGAPELTGIALNARIWNTGEPSAATGWALTIIPPKYDARFVPIYENS